MTDKTDMYVFLKYAQKKAVAGQLLQPTCALFFTIMDTSFEFIEKKTERLIAALYLVSQNINDRDPIKWLLREHGLSLISDIERVRIEGEALIRESESHGALMHVREIRALLEVLVHAQMISSMNHEILSREFSEFEVALREGARGRLGEGAGSFSTQFFSEGMLSESSQEGHSTASTSSARSKKGASHRGVSSSVDVKTISPQGAHSTNRRQTIMHVLKEKRAVTVKDIVRLMPQVSSKTVQRELLAMVAEGILRKMGEKRWTSYVLA